MSTAANTESASLPPVNLTKFGMITFLASEAMLFAGLISAYLISWIGRGHSYQPLKLQVEHFAWPLFMTSINTVFLLSSSATLYVGEKLVVKGKSPTLWLLLTTILGAVFVSIHRRHFPGDHDPAGGVGPLHAAPARFHDLRVALLALRRRGVDRRVLHLLHPAADHRVS